MVLNGMCILFMSTHETLGFSFSRKNLKSRILFLLLKKKDELQTSCQIKVLQYDGGGEFQTLVTLLNEFGILRNSLFLVLLTK